MRTLSANAIVALAFALTALPTAAGAATVVDRSPNVVGGAFGFNAANGAQGQNFLVEFTLNSAATLRSAAIYSSIIASNEPVIIKFRNDVGGSPDTSNFAEISTSLAVVDNVGSSLPGIQRLAANFAPLALAAGTYWFGMSGDNTEIGWSLNFNSSNADDLWQLDGDTLLFSFGGNTDAAFALYDTEQFGGGGVPEPSSWALLIAGFGLTGAALRRRRVAAAA